MSTDVLVFGWISEVGLILFTYLGAIIWLRKNKLADMSKPWWDLNQYWSSGLQAQTVSSPLTQPIADQPTLPDTKHSPESNSQIDLNIHEL